MIKNFLLFLSLLSVPFAIATADEDVDVSSASEEQCFQMLKDDMTEAGTFGAPLQELENMTYQDLETGFSRFYKNLSSFGNFEVSEPIVETRVYSFGEQTGYMHPVLSPFPVSTESEVWDEPAKENILVEEYVVDPRGNKHFINCGFISINTDRPTEVTRENYYFDKSLLSLKKTVTDGSYKSWYSEILSYDREDKPLVVWKRLFVYPKTTQNDYFNKYDVADANLAHTVESFDVLSFFLQPIITLQDTDESGVITQKTYTEDDAGELVEITVPEVLQPVKREGINVLFAKSGYYNAIEAAFPEFAELLSFRGSLKYETVKKILTEEEQDPEVLRVFYALYNYKDVRSYYVGKLENESTGMEVEDPTMDTLLVEVANTDEVVQKIEEEQELAKKNEQSSTEERDALILKLSIVSILALLLLGTVFAVLAIRKRRHSQGNDNAQ